MRYDKMPDDNEGRGEEKCHELKRSEQYIRI